MSEDIATREPAGPAPLEPPAGTLARKLNQLIEQAHPAGRGPYSNAEVAALVSAVTGVKISYGAVWELRTGRTINPTKRVIEALAATFGVPAGYFFDDYGDERSQELAERAELLALIREADVDPVQLRAFLCLPAAAREAVTTLIEHTAGLAAGR